VGGKLVTAVLTGNVVGEPPNKGTPQEEVLLLGRSGKRPVGLIQIDMAQNGVTKRDHRDKGLKEKVESLLGEPFHEDETRQFLTQSNGNHNEIRVANRIQIASHLLDDVKRDQKQEVADLTLLYAVHQIEVDLARI